MDKINYAKRSIDAEKAAFSNLGSLVAVGNVFYVAIENSSYELILGKDITDEDCAYIDNFWYSVHREGPDATWILGHESLDDTVAMLQERVANS